MADKNTKRVPKSATVERTEWLGPEMVRVHLTGDDLARLPRPEATDAYVKLLFAPEGADYTWPFDPEEIRETAPREQWPVTRTYTIRWIDTDAGRMAVDFVVHGGADSVEGLAGPWAASAAPGDRIGFLGPGGAWSPEAGTTVLVGDEAAIPAIAAALDALPEGARAVVFAEVSGEDAHLPLRVAPGIDIHWVHRDGTEYGVALADAVRRAEAPAGDDVRWFVHGNADMIKDLRRLLLVERGIPRETVSISGYWRTGMNEDAWQSSKREFVEKMEAEQGR